MKKNKSSLKYRNRFVSFTFDDGFIKSANKIDKILNPYKATFYIVFGWVKPNKIPIKDCYNIGINHGSIDDWKKLSIKGHDIGSHSMSHNLFKNSDICNKKIQKEYEEPLKLLKKIHSGPYSLAFPYNINIKIKTKYDSIRLGTINNTIFNKLKNLDLYRINSWGDVLPKNRKEEKIIQAKISKVPSYSWLVFNFHGLDGEGWRPLTSKYFIMLKNFIIKEGFQIKNVAEMTNLIRINKNSNNII